MAEGRSGSGARLGLSALGPLDVFIFQLIVFKYVENVNTCRTGRRSNERLFFFFSPAADGGDEERK